VIPVRDGGAIFSAESSLIAEDEIFILAEVFR
jgi:hypothetical protein